MIWLDAQLSPAVAQWISKEFKMPCIALRDLGLRDAEDEIIFEKGKKENIILITKDTDFVDLVTRFNFPPKVILLTCGNTSNQKLKQIFQKKLAIALSLLENEALVEIGDL